MQNDDMNVGLGLPYHETEEDKNKRAAATKEELSKSLEELKKLRESLSQKEGKLDVQGELADLVNATKKHVEGTDIEAEIASVERRIKNLRSRLNKASNDYQAKFDRIQEIIKEQNELLDSSELLSEEEISHYREEFNEKKLAEITSAEEIRKNVELLKNHISLLRKQTIDLLRASAMGLSLQEYLEINEILNAKQRMVLNGIFTSMGLDEIIAKGKDISEEEKSRLAEAKETVFKKISEFRQEHTEATIIDSIQALYSIDVQMTKKGSPKTILLNGIELESLKKNVSIMPEKVPDFGAQAEKKDYEPDKVPEDMLGASVGQISPEEIRKRFDEAMAYQEEQQKQLRKIQEIRQQSESNTESAVSSDTNETDKDITNDDVFAGIAKTMSDSNIREMFEESIAYEEEKKRQLLKLQEIRNKNESLNNTTEDITTDDVVNEDKLINNTSTSDVANDEVIENISTDNVVNSDKDVTTPIEEESNAKENNVERRYVAMTPEEISKAIENIEYDKNGNKYSDYSERLRTTLVEYFDRHPEIRRNEGESNLAFERRVADGLYEETGWDFRIYQPDKMIPGTNIPMPRERRPYEDDEQYVQFLESYYNEFLPKQKEEVDEFVTIDQPQARDIPGIESVVVFNDKNTNKIYVRKYATGRYQLNKGDEVRIDGALCYEISNEDYERLLANSNDEDALTPYRVVDADVFAKADGTYTTDSEDKDIIVPEEVNENNTMNNDVPRIGMNDDPEVLRIGMNDDPDVPRIGMNDDQDVPRIGMKDTVVFYRENTTGDFYANQDTIDRFGLAFANPEMIDGEEYFRVSNDQVLDIIDAANGDTVTDYRVEVRDFDLQLQDETVREPDPEPVPEPEPVPTPGPEPEPEPVPTPGPEPEPKPEPVPTPGPEPEPEPEPVPTPGPEPEPKPEPDKNDDVDTIELPLFRDLDSDNAQAYAPVAVLDSLGIIAAEDPIDITGVPSIKISKRAEEKINELAEKSVNPKYVVKYIDVHLKKKDSPVVDKPIDKPIDKTTDEKTPKKARPHVEAIIHKLTDGLVIKPKDVKRYKANNIHAAKKWKEELNEGNFLYSVVSFLPKTVIQFPVNCFRAVFGGLFLGKRGKEVVEELKKRLDNLSEEELQVLFEEYRGHQLKTDMNNQINPLILDRLRRYGMEKVTAYNKQVSEHYKLLFSLVKEIEAIDKKLSSGLSDEERNALLAARNELLSQAAGHVREIEDIRVKADNLLSGGIHGLEEDFKAVATKLSYVGKRFVKTKKFDNELQAKLGKYGQGLRDAMAADDDEAIVENFMALESEYAMNTNIRKISLTGSKSVGSKYYTPVPEEFNYADDQFIRNIFSSIAIATSIYSAINAYRVHQVESQEALRQEQLRADAVNKHNDATVAQAHQVGRDIESHRGTFQEGMAAQTQGTSLNTSGVFERGNLDANDWHFTDQYHIDDAAAHIDYNQFHDEAVNGIQSTVNDCASGVITEAQALQQMADVANKAQGHLVDTVQHYKQICSDYAATHPQFDLHAFNDSMDYLVQHSGAVEAMNQGVVDVTDLAGTLSTLNSTHMDVLSSLPSDMYSTLMASFATCAYVGHVTSSMKNSIYKGKYGNEITDMMSEYASSHGEETTGRSR